MRIFLAPFARKYAMAMFGAKLPPIVFEPCILNNVMVDSACAKAVKASGIRVILASAEERELDF